MARSDEAAGAGAGRPVWGDDVLGFLTAPVDRARFLQDHYEKTPLLSARSEPRRYADILTLAMLDAFVAEADLREGMADVTNANSRVSRDDYVTADGRIDGVALAAQYQKGSTLIFPQLHESMFGLAQFCRALEEVFSCHVQTNIYLTPGTGKGFPPHYDNHDVFVMQVSGAKAWRLYGTPVTTPYRGERFQLGRHKADAPTAEFTLNPGDCLYIPRGLMHDAENVGDAPSLHVTVGLITKTWADLMLEAVSELALAEPEFRRSLPPGYAGRDYDREAARAHFARLARLVADQAEMDGAFDLMADQFLRSRRPDLRGTILSGPVPGAGGGFRLRPLAPWNLAEDEGATVLVGPGGDLRFAPEDGDALGIALSGAPFAETDLACAEPAEMIRKLWTHGYLERL
ncbi:MAG: cupin domain-containing protein [Allosphingosinicella sp.]|uniref:cupin domain-containing protein n=1 Tax=Allosphingosinicella sp. TaxID=2823234 RepID=UPI003931D259